MFSIRSTLCMFLYYKVHVKHIYYFMNEELFVIKTFTYFNVTSLEAY